MKSRSISSRCTGMRPEIALFPNLRPPEIRLGGNRLRSMAHAGSASGYCQAGKPFMCIEANLSFISIREHTRLAERWAGKACRRGSLRWLLLRASVSCDAQQLNRHQPPSPKMAKRVLALLVEVATCQLPLRPRHNRLLGRHGLSTVSMQPRARPEMQSRLFSNTLRERNVTMPRLRRLPTLCRAKRLRALIFQLDSVPEGTCMC